MKKAKGVKVDVNDVKSIVAATNVLDDRWPTCVQMLYDNYGDKFKAIEKMAIIGIGSAPSMMC